MENTDNSSTSKYGGHNYTSSINDIPINYLKDNLLGIENYAQALADFICTSSTPLTIGIQGEWGTGKTSIMFMIKELLGKKNVASAWVNTWEYSLFRTPAETTPSVLKGLLENLIKTCKEEGHWKNEQRFNEVKDQVYKGLAMIGKFAINIAANKFAGVDAPDISKERLTSEIAEVKEKIRDIIDLIIKDPENPIDKIVFFVDDLDRIDPPVAVEILEALKNIFDLNYCVFILAIDYDVVIKGLEKKFGPKTDKNEREFRSFFDKIIQLPFSMPVSAYQIDKLLKAKFESINLKIDNSFEDDLVKIVQLAVGYTPRSIKRYINSYSLLKRIRDLDKDHSASSMEDFCLFTLIGIQISFPTVYRLISKEPDFTKWNKVFARQNGVEEIISPEMDHHFIDEEWEQFLWNFCQKDTYLKVKALSIIELLNILRDKLGEDLPDIIQSSIAFTSITSVDDDVEAKQSKPFQRVVLNNLEEYLNNMKYSELKFKSVKELITHIERSIRDQYPDFVYKYSPSMGVTIYANEGGRSKFAGISIYRGFSVDINLLRDFRKDYRKPLIEGIETSNIRNYSHGIDWYKLIVPTMDDFESSKGRIFQLIENSKDLKENHSGKILKEKDFGKKNADLLSKYLSDDYTYELT
ncbi:MAG: KAP family NTPase [Bacteroidetes bacterium]|nr:KAP family NTPase [Bacteroidota bacterium]